jgi:hypothetical protein
MMPQLIGINQIEFIEAARYGRNANNTDWRSHFLAGACYGITRLALPNMAPHPSSHPDRSLRGFFRQAAAASTGRRSVSDA